MDELEAQRRAREFSASLDLSNIRDDLSVYLRSANAQVLEEALGPGESGITMTRPDGKHVITINKLENVERQRFTICHEVGHIVLDLPSAHQTVAPWSYAKRDLNEICCDAFAAELLMPLRLWVSAVPKGAPTVDAINQLAERFGCSYPAAASRFATLTVGSCAFVTMERGSIRYAARSASLRRVKAWIAPKSSIPQGSVAHQLRAEGKSHYLSGVVPQDIWFENWQKGLELQEIGRHYGSSDTTTSLLWIAEDELPEKEFDRFGRELAEDEGLAELTGELPWPGKNRRR